MDPANVKLGPVKTGEIELLFRNLKDPASHPRYDGNEHSVKVLPVGFKRTPENRAFSAQTIFEKNIDIALRDGTILKGDIFRPDVQETVPALLPWSPYGKSGRGLNLTDMPGNMGIPKSNLSGFEKFEGPDPAEWTTRGYAVVNVDSRGSWDSEGYLCWAGDQEGRDGYDAIEWIARQPWCNGSVCLVGNSWLGRSQWYIAAQRPPSLKCIAPLEASSDLYREIHVRGGIACEPFLEWMMNGFHGRERLEDPVAMLRRYPVINDYWLDKRAKIDQIEVPAYVLASYSTMLHLPGSLRGFEEIPHQNKWLRIHTTQEWHDLYQPSTNTELQLFFDRYAKGIDNELEKLPKVRVSLLGYNLPNIVNLAVPSWPVPETTYMTMFLSPGERLLEHSPSEEAVIQYQSDVPSFQIDNDPGELYFRYTFTKRMYLLGAAKTVLWMSCNDADDMDIFLQIRKEDASGKVLQYHNIPKKDIEAQGVSDADVPLLNTLVYLGPHGQIRASHRAIDEELSTPHFIRHKHLVEERISPGTVVRVETSIWPGGIIFDPGESIVLKISGHPMYLAEFPTLRGQFKARNTGKHDVHTGGSRGSHLVVPFVDL
ncbi:hypothetical protein RBB50_005891 [Rhinocladiella similis]